jgi:hypothetical protein
VHALGLAPILLLAGTFDGAAAQRHAAALAALGPHPLGSPRARAAAEYVAAQFRQAGLDEVHFQEFVEHGLRGQNVIGVLRAPGPEFVVIGAHHDTAPAAPGAYDDGGGVGVLIEAARVLSRAPARPRTLVFVSWDGEESEALFPDRAVGSRAYARSLGGGIQNLVAALVIEMCGWEGGRPVLHPIAYADPLRPGRSVVAPDWLVRAALDGSRGRQAPLGVGDPYLSWLYQPAVRTFRATLYGDDLSLLQAGAPAVFASDSSFSAFYPWYHQSTDTSDKVDADALARMGRAVLAASAALERAPRGESGRSDWFAASGWVIGRSGLLALGALSAVPVLAAGLKAGGILLGVRVLQLGLFALVLYRHPVPILWVFLLPNLLLPLATRRWFRLATWAPLVALLALGVAAWRRGMVAGVWLAPWELTAAALALALCHLRAPTARRGARATRAGRRGRAGETSRPRR